jgi:hypothetical protein
MRATARVTRQDYGIAEDEIVIVYSGGTQAYQRLSEIAGFVTTLSAHVERLRFVIFTADPDAARQELGALVDGMHILIASDDAIASLAAVPHGSISQAGAGAVSRDGGGAAVQI